MRGDVESWDTAHGRWHAVQAALEGVVGGELLLVAHVWPGRRDRRGADRGVLLWSRDAREPTSEDILHALNVSKCGNK